MYTEPALVPSGLPLFGWISNEIEQAQRAHQTVALAWISSLNI
jgi:hypothetical protein